MILVVIESPLAGDFARNRAYARACMRDSLSRGEAPYASHLLYDQPDILDDTIPAEREQGIKAGFAWGQVAELRVFYTDLGMSGGMKRGLEAAKLSGQPYEMRSIKWADPGPTPEEKNDDFGARQNYSYVRSPHPLRQCTVIAINSEGRIDDARSK